MFTFFKNLLNKLHFRGAGKLGVALGTPSIGLLVNQDYAQRLAHVLFPGVNDVFVPLIAGVAVGAAGLMLLYSKSPAAAVFTPNPPTS